MGFSKKTIKEYDIGGKKVLLRADYNVPIADDGKISDDYRIKQSVPTVQYLLEQGCKVIICSHLGRPESANDKKCSLQPVAKRLEELLNKPVEFVGDCIGPEVKKAADKLEGGQVLLLENVRFHPEEEKNDENFARAILEATEAEVFVQDGFGVVHRAHATTEAIAKLVPALAGLLLEKEVDTITNVMDNPQRPLMAIIGGAKIADKLGILQRFIDIADIVAVGGAMANTFLQAKGLDIGKSVYDKDGVDKAKEIIERAEAKSKEKRFVFYLPQDGVVASKIDKTAATRIVDWSTHTVADVENYPKAVPPQSSKIAADEMILDIGPFSASFIVGAMQLCDTVIWNGNMGMTETDGVQGPIGPFSHGSELVVESMTGQFGHKPFSLVGGGDTASYVIKAGVSELLNHVSTGGGAGLELMSGLTLPGVAVLWDK